MHYPLWNQNIYNVTDIEITSKSHPYSDNTIYSFHSFLGFLGFRSTIVRKFGNGFQVSKHKNRQSDCAKSIIPLDDIQNHGYLKHPHSSATPPSIRITRQIWTKRAMRSLLNLVSFFYSHISLSHFSFPSKGGGWLQ